MFSSDDFDPKITLLKLLIFLKCILVLKKAFTMANILIKTIKRIIIHKIEAKISKLTRTQTDRLTWYCSTPTPEALEQIADKYNNFGLLILTEKKSKVDDIIKVDKEIGMSSFFSRRSDFIKLSGFDENFFLYYEDVDLVKRYLSNNFIV